MILLSTFHTATLVHANPASFSFANYYGDHMVLQKGPHSASVWGYIPECDPVTVTFNGKTITATLVAGASGGCRFKATLPTTTCISFNHAVVAPYFLYKKAATGPAGKLYSVN